MNNWSTKHRILVRDDSENLFRIFNVHFLVDKFNERYIKFSFPDLIRVNLLTYKAETINSSFPEVKQMPPNICEYSFHYINGRGHWKSSQNGESNYHEVRSDLAINELIIVSIFRITLFDLSILSKFSKKIALGTDVVLENIFNKKPLSIEITLIKKINFDFKFVNQNDNFKPVSYALINKDDILLRIQVYEIENALPGTGINIFQQSDPKSNVDIELY